jgi:hypothetical protein
MLTQLDLGLLLDMWRDYILELHKLLKCNTTKLEYNTFSWN